MNKMIKIWCISDTHCKHSELKVPNVDMVIHAGDASNYRDFSQNEAEMREFLQWFSKLPIKYKIYVPGNHDTSVEQGMHDFDDYPEINVLINDYIYVDEIKIYGSPITPTFGYGWAYNCSLSKIKNKYWDNIEDDTDILITHGPPKGMLDFTEDRNYGNKYVHCGCKALLNRVEEIQPKYHIFGHIHDESNIFNSGQFKPAGHLTTFVNASVCNLRYNVENNGQIIEI